MDKEKISINDLLNLYWPDRTPAHIRSDEEDDVIQDWLAAHNEDWSFDQEVEFSTLAYPYDEDCGTSEYTPYEPLENDIVEYICTVGGGTGTTFSSYNQLPFNVFTEEISEDCNDCLWGYRRIYGNNHEAYIGSNFINEETEENLIDNCGNFPWNWTQRHSLYMMFEMPFSTEDADIIIQQARIYVTAKETSVDDTFDVIIRGFAEQNVESEGLPLLFDASGLRTYTNVSWTLGQWTTDQEYESPDISCVLQETLEKIGTVAGFIPVVIEPDIEFYTEFMRVAYGNNTLDGTKRIRLDLQYTAIFREFPEGGCTVGGSADDFISNTGEHYVEVFCGGTADVEYQTFTVEGGVVCSGEADVVYDELGDQHCLYVHNIETSGGVVCGGLSEEYVLTAYECYTAHNIVSEGGLVAGGGHDIYYVETTDFQGGMLCGGESTVDCIYDTEMQGGADAGSRATHDTYDTMAGGAQSAGEVLDARLLSEIAAGGADASGEADTSLGYVTFGGVTSSGVSEVTDFVTRHPSGGSVSGGVANVNISQHLFYQTSGSVIVDGEMAAGFKDAKVQATGGVTVSTEQSPAEYHLRFTKKVDFSWRLNAEVTRSIDVLWNVGRLSTYWYRVISKGGINPSLPQDQCCQKFIMNIHARSLRELCEKLSARRFKFPIESVQRFSRPASNTDIALDEAQGINHDFNNLIEVEVCGIPECADFCVDQDVKVTAGLRMKLQVNAFKEHESEGNVSIAGSAITRHYRNVPSLSYTSEDGISIGGEATCISSVIDMRGGASLGGSSAIQANRWTFIGGEANEKTRQLFGETTDTTSENENEQLWSLTNRVTQDDGLYCSTDISFGKKSQLLTVKGFRIDLPEWASILEVNVRIDRYSTQVGVRDKDIYLFNSSGTISDNLAAQTDWPLLETTKSYGTTGWRSSEITRSELIDPDFGVAIRVQAVASHPATVCKIDYISVQVTYQDAAGSIIRISSDVGATAISPTYHYESTGSIDIGSSAAYKKTEHGTFVVVGAGVELSGLALVSAYETGSGGVHYSGEATVTPYMEYGSGGISSSGLAEVKPFFETMTGGLSASGIVSFAGDWWYQASGQITIGGSIESKKNSNHVSIGDISMTGSAVVKKSHWTWTSSGSISVDGAASQIAGDIIVPNQTMTLGMRIIQTNALFLNDIHVGDAIGSTGTLSKCGCFTLPTIIELSHGLSRDNILSKFLSRNGLSIGRTIELRYNETNDSWQANLHYKGRSGDANSIERWSFIFDLQCTSVIGSVAVGRNIWKLGIRIFRKNLNTLEDFDTRILIAVMPDTICGNVANQVNFTINYDTQQDAAVVSPNAVVYQNMVYDNIGLFNNRAWLENPDLFLKVSQASASRPQRRVDLTNMVLT